MDGVRLHVFFFSAFEGAYDRLTTRYSYFLRLDEFIVALIAETPHSPVMIDNTI